MKHDDAKHLKNQMLQIKALDPDASILFSEWTMKWYVSARVEESDGHLLRSHPRHRDTPEEAVSAYLKWLTEVDYPNVLATNIGGKRQHWRWNGGAFALDPYWKPSDA